MTQELFRNFRLPDTKLFRSTAEVEDPRIGDTVGGSSEDYAAADIVIFGCPHDEGIRRSGGRSGSADAPEAVRREFYRLSTFGITQRVVDLGDITTEGRSLEDLHAGIVSVAESVMADGKRVIILGGGGDLAYACGVAMSRSYGHEQWIGVNVDSRLDVAADVERNSQTSFRQLLDEGILEPDYFYEAGFQSQLISPAHFEYLRARHVHRISLDLLRSRTEADLELKEQIRAKFIGHSSSLNTFFSFDMQAVRASDAPGTTDPSPLGLRADEFVRLVAYAASLANTKIVLFSEINPRFDIDGRTAKLAAASVHKFCVTAQ